MSSFSKIILPVSVFTNPTIIKNGVVINRPPRDGHMAFIKSPDGISIELIQENGSLPMQEPWQSMKNIGKR